MGDVNGRIKLTWGQVVVLVGWIVTAALAYGAVDSRVSVLEDRYDRLFQDVTYIRNRIDQALGQ